MQLPSIKDGIHDAFIGVIIALVSIPISMGYASVAGLPVVYGLYGSLLPILIFAFVSSSPRCVFGVDAAPAAIVGGMIATLGIGFESAAATNIIPLLTLLVSLWLLLFYFIRADRIITFISQAVMGGFISGISTTIILMQVPKLFGGRAAHGEVIELLRHIFEEGKFMNLPSLALGLGTIILLLVCRKFCPKIPMQALLMFAGAAVFWKWEDKLRPFGIATLPAVKAGLPSLALPDINYIEEKHIAEIFITSLTVDLVILSETLLATTNLSRKYREKINSRREVLAYALGNLSAGLTGCCPINGSISRSGIADQFGVKTQLMSVTASLTMALILLFGTGFIFYLPLPVLTGIVISALTGTLEFSLAHRLKKFDRMEFLIFYAAFFAVLFLGTIYGVIVGFLLSTVTFIFRLSKPATDFLGIVPGIKGYYSLRRRNSQAQALKGLVLYRFSAPLFYANIEQFCEDILKSLEADWRTEPVDTVIVDSSGIISVDASAAERLLSLYEELCARDVRFFLAGHASHVNDQLRTLGARKLIEEKAVRPRILYALRDSGFRPPYSAEDVESRKEEIKPKIEETLYNPDFSTYEKNEYTEHIAEIEWAYGEESEAILAELAKKMPQSEQSELEQEIYFEELAMLNPEMAKQVADIIAEMELAAVKNASYKRQLT